MKYSDDDGLFLHASSVMIDGGALLFLGHSTAGKSTLALLLANQFPTLADDTVFAARDSSGVWRVVDGKCRLQAAWSENSGLEEAYQGGLASSVKNGKRLLGCLRIHKAEYVRVTALAPVEIARYLMDAAMEVDLQQKIGRLKDKTGKEKPDVSFVRKMRGHWFQLSAEIARSCPGWQLWFPRDSHQHELTKVIMEVAEAGKLGPS